MSRYETVNDRGRRSRLRRGLLVSSSIAWVLAAGCSPLPAPPPRAAARDAVADTVVAGFDAFKADDQTTLENDIQKLSDLLPADETDAAFSDCSPQGFRLRRIERAKRLLEHLDDSPIPSMGDEEKYVYFQQLIENIGLPLAPDGRVAWRTQTTNDPLQNSNAPSDFECQATDGYQQSATADVDEQEAIRSAGRDRMRAWLIDLRRTDDTQLDVRLQSAASELNQNNLSLHGEGWRPPAPDTPKA